VSAPQPMMNAGAILSGRWQIQDFVGSGETGEVYGVRDMHSTGTFALKLFWPNALRQPELWSAVQHTARTASALGVEGVARAYDFGIDANSGRPFFVAERVSWSSLADRVRLRGPLTPADMATALEVLARALDGAHAAGIVHRDLKPENVFISPENAAWVRLTDFGTALLRAASPPPPGWGGTVGWVAPDAADPNARSMPAMDVFALGLVTFFALSGGALHRAARSTPIDPGALWQELTAPLDSASARARELGASLDPAFDPWFQRAVASPPQARFGSISEMASSFTAIARTLIAPQSQNAVAVPGVAAAIAQPLIFQPESLPPPPARPAEPAPLLGVPAPAQFTSSDDLLPAKKRSLAPLLIGGAVACFALTGLGAVLLYKSHSNAAEAAASASAAAASASANALLAAASAASAAPSAATAAASAAPPASSSEARVTFQCQPQACEAVVCDGKALPGVESGAVEVAPGEHSCVVSRAGFASKAFKLSAKAGESQTLEFTLSAVAPLAATVKPASSTKPAVAPVASAKPAATATKPAASATKPAPSASAKPAASAKPSATAPAKKKCGSTFIPCK